MQSIIRMLVKTSLFILPIVAIQSATAVTPCQSLLTVVGHPPVEFVANSDQSDLSTFVWSLAQIASPTDSVFVVAETQSGHLLLEGFFSGHEGRVEMTAIEIDAFEDRMAAFLKKSNEPLAKLTLFWRSSSVLVDGPGLQGLSNYLEGRYSVPIQMFYNF